MANDSAPRGVQFRILVSRISWAYDIDVCGGCIFEARGYT